MSEREIFLVEDAHAGDLGPAALVRPVFDLVVGALTQRQRVERLAGRKVSGALVRGHLVGLDGRFQERHSDASSTTDSRLFINAAWLPDERTWPLVESLGPGEYLRSDEYALLALASRPKGGARPFPDPEMGKEWRSDPFSWNLNPGGNERVEVSGKTSDIPLLRPGEVVAAAAESIAADSEVASKSFVLRHSWELVSVQEELLKSDLEALIADDQRLAKGGLRRLVNDPGAGIHVRGTEAYAAEGLRLSAPVSLDAEAGPILLGENAGIGPFSVLEGPLFVAEGAQILGGRVAHSYIGPGCRIRGEVAQSTFLGWTNKAHEGFVGHSYFGEWVNLGALTTTSNLKNTYGEIRVGPRRDQATGLTKLGSVVGDHTRTAIGTMMATGSLIGVGVNLVGSEGIAPHWLPSFVWGVRERASAFDLARFLEIAARVLARRDRSLSAADREVLVAVHAASAAEREEYLAHRR
ncbi:MAG: hypothetical protein KBD56_01725 [Candidatus Eisenbacteria bacterium]|nr:hypothetical protein [Candidatus Eisenbacteria bacterium]